MLGSLGVGRSPAGAPLRARDWVLFVMACPRVLQTNEEADRDRRSLACRRSVSWYGFRLNIIKETNEMASQLSQVRLRTLEANKLTHVHSDAGINTYYFIFCSLNLK